MELIWRVDMEFDINQQVIVNRDGLFGARNDGAVGTVLKRIEDEGYVVQVDDNELYFLKNEIRPYNGYTPHRYRFRGCQFDHE